MNNHINTIESSQEYLFYATAFNGLEGLLKKEIEEAGGHSFHEEKGVVRFKATFINVLKLNYTSRIGNKFVLILSGVDNCTTFEELYRRVTEIDWPSLFSLEKTFAVEASLTFSVLDHSVFTSQKAKDGVADCFIRKMSKRPDVNTENPDVYIDIRLVRNELTVGLNLSGERLFKRGYRTETNAAPMKETLAAGLVKLALDRCEGKYKRVIDPMCGSGTIIIEAAMKMLRIPPGKLRGRFSFMNLAGYKEKFEPAYHRIVQEEERKIIRPSPFEFVGCEHAASFLSIAKENAAHLKLDKVIKFEYQDFFKPTINMTKSLLIFNPPYGERMSGAEDINEFYARIGDTLKHDCQGSKAFILAEFGEPMKHIGLRPSRRIELYNGKIECRLLEFDIF